MKKTFLFCTKLRFFLSEIPPIILLFVTILHNNDSEGILKLYPLIAFSVISIVLVFLYYFRMISISTEEIRSLGVFSSKDSAIINKDKTLVFTIFPKSKMVVSLYEKGTVPAFTWSKSDVFPDVELFREKAIGGKRALTRVLSYFESPSEDIQEMMSKNDYTKVFKDFIVSKAAEENKTTYSIKFTNTI